MTAPSKCSKRFPILQGGGVSIPWGVASMAYLAYAKKYGSSQSMERLAERGGFAVEELDVLLPTWRYLVSYEDGAARERDALRAANAELEARLAASVDRKVALLAASICFDACYEDMGEENSKTVEQTLAGAKPYPLGSRVHQITVLALARAEAEAAKPQADKEKSDG